MPANEWPRTRALLAYEPSAYSARMERAPESLVRDEDAFVGVLDVPIDLPLAGPGSRGLAALLDMMLLTVGYAFLLAIQALALPYVPPIGVEAGIAIVVLISYFLQVIYFVAFEVARDGQTPGKRALALRVVQDDGTSVGLLPSLIRNLLRPIDFLPLAYSIALIAVFVTRKAQRLGDLAAGTVVVREPRASKATDSTSAGVPPGLGAQDAALIESYLSVSPGLEQTARERLAAALLEMLARQDPKRFAVDDASLPASDRLQRLLAPGPESGSTPAPASL